MKVYLAGPMRGVPHFNFPAFNEAADMLRSRHGWTVFNPAERDAAVYGPGLGASNQTGDEAYAEMAYGFSLRDALAADMEFICREAEAIAMLPGWDKSKGALAELATARALGLMEIYL